MSVRARLDRDSERGASIVLALAMITIVGVSLVALLGYATTSFSSVTAVESQRTAGYAAEGAVQTAIQVLRADAAAGATLGACPTVTYPAGGGQPAVPVSCAVDPPVGSGVSGNTAPPYALWSVGQSASETGIELANSGTTLVAGPVTSNSPATGASSVDSMEVGTLDLTGYAVQARGTCTGTYTVSAPSDKQCSTGQAYGDPAYPSQPLPSLTTLNPLPTCAASNAVLQFSPGFYTDPRELERPDWGGCRSNYLYFKPGVYYFDFGWGFGSSASLRQWDVGANRVIVGGEPKGWNPSTTGSVPGVPGGGASAGCKTDRDGATSGVQFVFGGESRLAVRGNNARMELCADPTPVGTTQQIAVYGQRTGVEAAQTATSVATGVTSTPAAGWSGLTPPPNRLLPIAPEITPIDGQSASFVLPSQNPGSSASLQLSGFHGLGAAVPPGSTNVDYSLRIAHREIGTNANNIMSLQLQVGASCSISVTKRNSTTPAAPVVDTYTPSCLDAAVANDFTVTYTATARNSRTFTETLDGIELVVTYTPPVVRAQTGCTVSDIDSCSIVNVNANRTFVVWGTVYAPLGSVRVTLGARSIAQFRRGVVARAVKVTGTSPTDTSTLFCLGYGSPCMGPSRVIELTAQSGRSRVRALVQLVDVPSLGGRVRVLSWNVDRI